jgi:spermidine synthase
MPARGRPRPIQGHYRIHTGSAALVPDRDGRAGWTVYINGLESSHLDLDDATRLDFEYMRWIGDLVDVMAPPGEPLRVVHLGGAGCTLARYVAATRPGSRQLVIEVDGAVIDLARDAFGIHSGPLLRLRAGDARAELQARPDASADVVIRDAFAEDRVPEHLLTTGFLTEVSRVLRPGGLYLANLADSPRLATARREAATVLRSFAAVALVAEPGQLHGRRYGNVVLAGSAEPLATAAWQRRLAAGPVRARLLETDEVGAFASGHRPYVDAPAALAAPPR